MDTLIFIPAGKLSEYLNKDEITYNIWHSSNIWPDARIKDNGILYPDIKSNLFLYQKLNEKDNSGLFEPLEFFNLLYEKLVYILNNIENPEEILFFLRHLNLGERQFLLFWYSLSYILLRLNGYPIEDFLKMKEPKYRRLAWMNLEFDHYYKELREKLEVHSKSPIEEIFLKELEADPDYESKKKVVTKLLYRQVCMIHFYNNDPINTDEYGSVIALKLGYTARNSGHKLHQHYGILIDELAKDAFLNNKEQKSRKKWLNDFNIVREYIDKKYQYKIEALITKLERSL